MGSHCRLSLQLTIPLAWSCSVVRNSTNELTRNKVECLVPSPRLVRRTSLERSGGKKDEDLFQDLVSRFAVRTSFVANPSVIGSEGRNLFGINHYAGNCSYDATGFVEKDTDILDSALATLLRNSSDPFISKLFAGPSVLVLDTDVVLSSLAMVSSVGGRHRQVVTGVLTPPTFNMQPMRHVTVTLTISGNPRSSFRHCPPPHRSHPSSALTCLRPKQT